VEEEMDEIRDEIQGMIEAMEAREEKKQTSNLEEENSEKEKSQAKKVKRTEEGKFIDPETGEEFDTASGLKLYQKYIRKENSRH
jgi:hypothetical protein